MKRSNTYNSNLKKLKIFKRHGKNKKTCIPKRKWTMEVRLSF